MNILVYKRTHNGGPGPDGCFGIYDCMGVVRDRDYDAVIGVGGIGPEARVSGIAGVVNWIGVGPHKRYVGKRGPEVTFDRFVYFGCDGPDFVTSAPALARRLYDHNVRSVLHGLTGKEMTEALAIVGLADDAPPSLTLKQNGGDVRNLRECKRDGRKIRCTGATGNSGLETRNSSAFGTFGACFLAVDFLMVYFPRRSVISVSFIVSLVESNKSKPCPSPSPSSMPPLFSAVGLLLSRLSDRRRPALAEEIRLFALQGQPGKVR
jgi:hypothetical protein